MTTAPYITIQLRRVLNSWIAETSNPELRNGGGNTVDEAVGTFIRLNSHRLGIRLTYSEDMLTAVHRLTNVTPPL